MTTQDIAAALQRVESVLRRRPEAGIVDDAPATARWGGGMRAVTRHASGVQVVTDMPGELGGSGDQVSPGWLLRAALASCAITRIAMAAATEGIELRSLEAVAQSRSDARGLLGMADTDGTPVPAAPSDVQLLIRISAPGVAAEQVQALVRRGASGSPVGCAVEQAVAVALHIEIEAA